MDERLKNHRDPRYRKKNPSLHYFDWDLGEICEEYEMDEAFVLLSTVNDKSVDSLLLNLLEMWCCLILQTLTIDALSTFLPRGRTCTICRYA